MSLPRIKHGTLTANQVAEVTLNDAVGSIEVMVVGNPHPIYFRVDGTDPTVKGDNCEVIPAAVGAALAVDTPTQVRLKMISTGAVDYCVRGV